MGDFSRYECVAFTLQAGLSASVNSGLVSAGECSEDREEARAYADEEIFPAG
jgi:hypothetical protein